MGPAQQRRRHSQIREPACAYQANINVEAPCDRRPRDQPALNAEEIEAIIALLQILTSGFAPE
jgi:hypothetical protein